MQYITYPASNQHLSNAFFGRVTDIAFSRSLTAKEFRKKKLVGGGEWWSPAKPDADSSPEKTDQPLLLTLVPASLETFPGPDALEFMASNLPSFE